MKFEEILQHLCNGETITRNGKQIALMSGNELNRDVSFIGELELSDVREHLVETTKLGMRPYVFTGADMVADNWHIVQTRSTNSNRGRLEFMSNTIKLYHRDGTFACDMLVVYQDTCLDELAIFCGLPVCRINDGGFTYHFNIGGMESCRIEDTGIPIIIRNVTRDIFVYSSINELFEERSDLYYDHQLPMFEKQLDDGFVIFKRADVERYLSEHDKNYLDILFKYISERSVLDGKPASDKLSLIVEPNSPIYGQVHNLILGQING